MPIEVINHGKRSYPALQASGFAARFAFPFAKELCKGYGYDIGCNRLEWKLPGAVPIDPAFIKDGSDAMNLAEDKVNYIFSSHCLEHLPDWVGVLNYWATKIKSGGVLFLYLPHPRQTYWRPWANRKHINILRPKDVRHYLRDSGHWKKVFVPSGHDLNHSYYAVAEKT